MTQIPEKLPHYASIQAMLDNQNQIISRLCSIAENCRNAKLSKINTSGYKGVQSKGKRWQASISCDRQFYYLGLFNTPELAALAYNKKAKELHGEFAYQNILTIVKEVYKSK